MSIADIDGDPSHTKDPWDAVASLGGHRFCTEDQPPAQRLEWLKEVVGREYANVEITPPKAHKLFNDLLIYPWGKGVRLSPIRSNPCSLERLSQEPTDIMHDCYFAVVLTSGQYRLEQGGREVYLKPGEMSLYDATQPHRIDIPSQFSKILVSIPRQMLTQRIPNIGNLTAVKIPTCQGVGAVTSGLIRSTVSHLHTFEQSQFLEMTEAVIDLFALSVGQVNKGLPNLTRHRQLTLVRVKGYIEQHIADRKLNTQAIAAGTGLSARYINNLFNDENTSLMRYVTVQRLEKSRRQMTSAQCEGVSITNIAMQCGFYNMSHFSRAFRQQYGVSPRQYRALNDTHMQSKSS